jgi:hypothetical protein
MLCVCEFKEPHFLSRRPPACKGHWSLWVAEKARKSLWTSPRSALPNPALWLTLPILTGWQWVEKFKIPSCLCSEAFTKETGSCTPHQPLSPVLNVLSLLSREELAHSSVWSEKSRWLVFLKYSSFFPFLVIDDMGLCFYLHLLHVGRRVCVCSKGGLIAFVTVFGIFHQQLRASQNGQKTQIQLGIYYLLPNFHLY